MTAPQARHAGRASRRRHLTLVAVGLLLLAPAPLLPAQDAPPNPAEPLPEAPAPQPSAQPPALQDTTPPTTPCQEPQTSSGTATSPATAQTGKPGQATQPCPPAKNWFARFLTGPQVKPLTPREKAHLAALNLLDPFNAVTILGNAGIAIGADAHTAYGPGMPGFARYVGVSYAEDTTAEFFGTFLISSLVHQDPHYHRMPRRSIPRRTLHAIVQVVWTRGDNGKNMLNYANLLGMPIEDQISNLYVPGQETDAGATAARFATGLGTAPIDNFITEFLPDVARRIRIRIVLVQRIINQVATIGGPGEP